MYKQLELSLTEQLEITDTTVERWKELFEFTDADIDCLNLCGSAIAEHLDTIIAEFYEWQSAQPEATIVVGDKDTLDRLRNSMRGYIQELFEGYYDIIYVNKRLRIGRVHHRIGVTPALYMAGVRKMHEILRMHIAVILAEQGASQKLPAVVTALTKVVTFDSQLVFTAYIGALTMQVERSSQELRDQAEELQAKVAQKTESLSQLSMRDPLTGLYNRRAFMDAMRRDLAMSQRSRQPVSLVFIDINRFKFLNDSKGHSAGDAVLRGLARTLQNAARETDTLCRYGGDEFCAVLPRAEAEEARIFCQRVLDLFGKERMGDTTLSMGIAQSGPDTFLDRNDLVDCADKAMYRAKTEVAGQSIHNIVCYEKKIETDPNVTSLVKLCPAENRASVGSK